LGVGLIRALGSVIDMALSSETKSSKLTRVHTRAVAALVIAAGVVACSVQTGQLDDLRAGGKNAPGTKSGDNGASDDGADPSGTGSDPSTPGNGDSTGNPGAPTDGGATFAGAEKLFRALETNLVASCGGANGSCHVAGTSTPTWLAAPDAYASIKKYPGIIVKDPATSKLLTKGAHLGPALPAALADSVKKWLTVEAEAVKATPAPTTEAFAIAAGANTIDISKGGTGVTGAKLTFDATINGSILTLMNLKLVAPAASGVHIVHPLFITVPPTGTPAEDPADSFSNLDQTVGAGATAQLGVGTLILSNWVAGAQLKIEFTTLASGTVVDAGTVGGCKSLATFTANAVPALQGNTCLNCHGAPGGSGYPSLDMSQVGKDNAKACAQALGRVNLANKAQSQIIIAATGGIAAHPFKNAPAAYTTAMLAWINNE
jgi:hypothetical protein